MNKKTKIWLIVAASLVLAGALMFGGVMSVLNWNFKRLSGVKYETKEYTLDGEYSDISVKTDSADIAFFPSSDEKTHVFCSESEKEKYSVTVENGVLTICKNDNRKWYDYIQIVSPVQKIEVHIPSASYGTLSVSESTGDITIPSDFKFGNIEVKVSTGDVSVCASVSGKVKITTSTGDITMNGMSVGELDVSLTTGKFALTGVECQGNVSVRVTTGKSYLTDLNCKNLTTSGGTGDITLNNVICEGKMEIERSTGDVKFEKCDASEMDIETDTGDVIGSLNSNKIFSAKTDTGKIDLPKSISGGICEIETDTGNIKITIG